MNARSTGVDTGPALPSFPPNPVLVDRLRTFLERHEVGAAYVFGRRPPGQPSRDVIGISTTPRGPVAARVPPAELLAMLRRAVADGVPDPAAVELSLLGPGDERDVLRDFAPIGAGGRVESACARAAVDPAGLRRLGRRLAAATLYVPAVGPEAGHDTDAIEGAPRTTPGLGGGHGSGHAAAAGPPRTAPTLGAGIASQARDGPERPRPLTYGTPVRYPLVRVGGRAVVTVFSSWPALLHADPPFPRQLIAGGHVVLDSLPDEVGLAIDPGTLHAIVVPPTVVAPLRRIATA